MAGTMARVFTEEVGVGGRRQEPEHSTMANIEMRPPTWQRGILRSSCGEQSDEEKVVGDLWLVVCCCHFAPHSPSPWSRNCMRRGAAALRTLGRGGSEGIIGHP